MGKAERAAEERYPRMSIGLVARGAFLEGVAWALPEVPSDALIVAMARAMDESDPEGGNANPDPGSESWEWWIPQARAAYAALRGAMQ